MLSGQLHLSPALSDHIQNEIWPARWSQDTFRYPPWPGYCGPGTDQKYRSSWMPYAMPELSTKRCQNIRVMLRMDTRNNRIPRKKKKKSHQWHFCPSPCPTALSNSAPRSQWSAMLTSFCDRPRGLCVVQCTSTDPNRWNHHGVGIRMALQQYSK